MSNSTSCKPIINYDDLNRIVNIKVTAADCAKIRIILACLSDKTNPNADLIRSVANKSTIEDMNRLHSVLFSNEMGWND